MNINKKKKVVIVFNKLHSYRIPILERLALDKNWDIVAVSNIKNKSKNKRSNIIHECYLEQISFMGFTWYKKDLKDIVSSSDANIFLFSIRNLDAIFFTTLSKVRKKSALWGIGVSGSYTKAFGRVDFPTLLRILWAKRAANIILYSKYAENVFQALGVRHDKIYTAVNTIDNIRDSNFENLIKSKNNSNILFIGTLYKEKGLDELVECFLTFIEDNKDIARSLTLTIIGDGEFKEILEDIVNTRDANDRVIFLGRIENRERINQEFDNSIACVSLKQSGLSILESFSNGVPFVTQIDAITGGERLCIQHLKNGFFINENFSLEDFFCIVASDSERLKRIGLKSFSDYNEKYSSHKMAHILGEAIESILDK